MKNYAVVCGSLNMDLVCTVERIPRPGETILGESFITKEGGKGANQAVAIARLGMPTSMIGCVGDDAFGNALLASLNRSGVDTQNVSRIRDCPTGTAHITVEKSGENNIVVIPSANKRITVKQILACEKLIERAYISLTQMEIPPEVSAAFLKLSKEKGIMTVLNPAPMPPSGIADDVLALTDVFTPNETEMMQMTGVTVSDKESFVVAANQLHKKGVKYVICTAGSNGAYFSGDGNVFHQKAIAVNAIDTTCAGDSFIGAFAVKLFESGNIEQALAFAARAASMTVTKMGAQESLPYRADLE